jgi:ABC-type Mn2+/Zn2+ transport system ATPase subunit
MVHTAPLPAVDAHNARVTYGESVVLNDVSFTVPSGSFVGVVGPNGAGKSTLLKTLVGIVRPTSGSVHVYGTDPARSRGLVAYVPQSENVNWHFPVTVWDVVMMGRTPGLGAFQYASKEDRRAVSDALHRVGLLHRSDDMIYALSGGQRQRVFVARALAQDARVLLLDEAFSGVDLGSQHELVAVLKRLCEEGQTILLSTHDLTNMAFNMDLVLCLNCHVCAWGPPDEAFTNEVMVELYGPHVASSGE